MMSIIRQILLACELHRSVTSSLVHVCLTIQSISFYLHFYNQFFILFISFTYIVCLLLILFVLSKRVILLLELFFSYKQLGIFKSTFLGMHSYSCASTIIYSFIHSDSRLFLWNIQELPMDPLL